MAIELATIIFYIFIASFAIQVLFYLSFSVLVFARNSSIEKSISLPISVIICAKNEAENLQKFLPSVINQKYTNFEIVLINDNSSDETLKVMKLFALKYNNIKVVNVNNRKTLGSKKHALTLGIKSAKNEHLLFTDADCKPISKNWITEMTRHFSENKSIILGYGKYELEKNSFVNTLVRYETLLTAIQYFSYAKLGSPYMSVGRNLAYTKTEFSKSNGFNSHIHIRSGDDDLFIQDNATATNTAISLHKNSFTVSKAPKSFNEWFRQKRRHISTANNYKLKHQLLLGLFYSTKLLFLLLFFILLLNINFSILLPFLICYYFIQYVIVGFSAKKLNEASLVLFLPFLEIGLVLFQFSIFTANTFSKPTHWK